MSIGNRTAFWIAIALALPARSAPVRAQDPAECGSENLLARRLPVARSVLGDAALVTDGTVAVEGAPNDAPVAVKLEGSAGSLTVDLGTLRPVGALYLQADANDSYQILASRDGAPDSFRLLGELPSVVEQGHGLRSRAVQFHARAVLRFLRVAQARGDGVFAVSEFAAYCRAPNPFPPPMRVDDGRGEVPVISSPAAIEHERESGQHRRAALIAAAILLAIALVCELGRRLAAARARRTEASGSATAAARGRDADGAGVLGRWSVHDRLRLMFVASGAAALIYEIVWLHLLRLVVGASALSVGIVLASFMGGMFLGSLLLSRIVSPARNALRVYAYLELGIAALGAIMPLVLPAARSIYVGLFGYGALGIGLRALVAAALLLPPTALMGATLPAVARRYSHGRRGGAALGGLYAANTLGAVLGCLLTGFYLLAVWDVWVATATAVALNLLIGVAAWRLADRPAPSSVRAPAAVVAAANAPLATTASRAPAREISRVAVYLASGLSGLTALGAQVVWTRVLTLLFGATVYAFAIILAVFLAGLGIGGVIASAQLRRGNNPTRWLVFCQLALVPALSMSGALLSRVLPYSAPLRATPVDALHVLHMLRAIDVIFPSALLWGMSFPFALAAASQAGRDMGRSSGHVYAANTLGAILGAVLISFWVIPGWGTQLAQQGLIACAALSAAAAFYGLPRPLQAGPSVEARPRAAGLGKPALAASVLAAGALAAGILPELSASFLSHGRHIWWVDAQDQYTYLNEGAASTVAVHISPNGYRNFHVSGRVEASNNPNDMRLERLLGHLSMLAHPRPEKILVVGLGAGITAGALTLHPGVKRIVICEIEAGVAGAARQFARENYDVLSDPRVELVVDDARHFLATTRERFDVITSDPIHPWVRGNSVLFSREYYEIVKSRLAPGGIATQWVPLYDTSEQAIQIQMRTFASAFPNGTVWNSSFAGRGYDVALLGSAAPLRLDLTAIQQRISGTPQIAQSLREVNIGSALELLSTFAASVSDMDSWFSAAPINRDFSLKLEYISGLALNRQDHDTIYQRMTAARSFPAALFSGPPELLVELRQKLLPSRTP
jgi:spermidine synthase